MSLRGSDDRSTFERRVVECSGCRRSRGSDECGASVCVCVWQGRAVCCIASKVAATFFGHVGRRAISTVVVVAMAGSADDDRDDVFDVATTLIVSNPRLGVEVSIRPSLVKDVDDSKFVSLDFYRSRGVDALLTSRLPQKQVGARHYSKLLAKVVGGLKHKRDDAFRQSVLQDATCHNLKFGNRAVVPNIKVLKASVLAKVT